MCLRQSGILLGVSDTVGGDCHDFHGPIGNVDSGTMSKCIFMAVNYQGLAITGCIVFRATCLGVCKGTHFCGIYLLLFRSHHFVFACKACRRLLANVDCLTKAANC